jgi:putative acetyltransferase
MPLRRAGTVTDAGIRYGPGSAVHRFALRCVRGTQELAHEAGGWMSASFTLRPYATADEGAAITLWHETWQQAYPSIDFAARLNWWRERWRKELVPNANIVVAEQGGALIGFVTIDLNGYLDQLVVGPEHWGSNLGNALVDEAKRLSPDGITLLVNTDNARAIRFYERNGFVQAGGDVNPTSGKPVLKMAWKPAQRRPREGGDP